MTDFQTCYDQPNYDSLGNAIITGNYKTGTTEPILLLATSTTGFSPTVYSTLYPQDKISYDFTWNTTEVTLSPAKGRITERIDEKNNRADYDFRVVQFIRYVGFFSEQYLPGKIDINATTGLVSETSTGTTFTSDFIVGDILGVFYSAGNNAPLGCFQYYEVTSIVSDTEMYVTGRTLTASNNVYYSRGLTLPNYMSPFQCNVTGGTYDNSAEYYTFHNGSSYNVYLGDNSEYSTFILSNNVFQSGPHYDMTFGGNVVGNTLNNVLRATTTGPYFQFNIITNNFDRNTIGSYFQRNVIDCDMNSNQIGDNFHHNTLGDSDGQDFVYNTIGSYFYNNFLTFNNSDFQNNTIGYSFYNNLIDSGFRNNEINGNFYNNLIRNSNFDGNKIGDQFYSNNIPVRFDDNTISGQFFEINVYSSFYENVFGLGTSSNTFGNPNNIGSFNFSNNNIGGSFTSNYFSGNTQYNIIGEGCSNNNVDTNFSYNQIGSTFANNTIANDFGFGGGVYRGNIVGNGFNGNIVGEYCYDNTFGDECYNNNLADNFINNKVSHGVSITTRDYDNSGYCQNNVFSFGNYSNNLSFSGGTGGNPILYTNIPTTVTIDALSSQVFVVCLSGGSITVQSIIV